MRFKVGDRVKVKESLISKLQTPGLIKILRCDGLVLKPKPTAGRNVKVNFPKYNIWYYINYTDLELKPVKNQQLLFEFME